MNIGNIKPILKAAKIADDTPVLEGLHGIGKSEIVKQYCDENGYFYSVLFLSSQEVGDLIGIPYEVNGVQHWSKPVWLTRMEEASARGLHNVLLLDELNRAQTDVLNSALQLVLNKQIHEHFLPKLNGENSQIIACTNPANSDSNTYMVQDFDPAMWDRLLKLEVTADLEGWLKWARENNVNKIVRDFLIDNPTKLHYTPEEGSGQQGTSPRSWAKLAQYIDQFEQGIVPEELHLNIVYGKIGPAIGAQFYTFYMDYSNNISLDDIEKFIKKSYKKTNDVNESAEALSKFMEDVESISKLEHINTLFDRDKENFAEPKTTYDDLISIFVLLTSFEIETLTSFLKDKKVNDKKAFYDLMKKDSTRELARKIKSKVKN